VGGRKEREGIKKKGIKINDGVLVENGSEEEEASST
jgi:hypothetical protein